MVKRFIVDGELIGLDALKLTFKIFKQLGLLRSPSLLQSFYNNKQSQMPVVRCYLFMMSSNLRQYLPSGDELCCSDDIPVDNEDQNFIPNFLLFLQERLGSLKAPE